MKRSYLSKLPKCIKRMLSSPKRGLQIGPILLVQTIVLPLMLVGSDMLSDGGVLAQMWPYTGLANLLAKASSGNQVQPNSMAGGDNSISDEAVVVNEDRKRTVNAIGVITDNTGTEREDQSERVERIILSCLFSMSILILIFSTLNLLMSNPLATLVRNTRTMVMMNSRELERKDVLVPLGNNNRV